jgi:hypothetical protein
MLAWRKAFFRTVHDLSVVFAGRDVVFTVINLRNRALSVFPMPFCVAYVHLSNPIAVAVGIPNLVISIRLNIEGSFDFSFVQVRLVREYPQEIQPESDYTNYTKHRQQEIPVFIVHFILLI